MPVIKTIMPNLRNLNSYKHPNQSFKTIPAINSAGMEL